MLELLLVWMLWQEPATFGLAWDPNPPGELAGYRVYMAPTSNSYAAAYMDVGLPPIIDNAVTWHPPIPLAPGTYFIVVTAYNTNGEESGYSNEISLTLPQIPDPLDNLKLGP